MGRNEVIKPMQEFAPNKDDGVRLGSLMPVPPPLAHIRYIHQSVFFCRMCYDRFLEIIIIETDSFKVHFLTGKAKALKVSLFVSEMSSYVICVLESKLDSKL